MIRIVGLLVIAALAGAPAGPPVAWLEQSDTTTTGPFDPPVNPGTVGLGDQSCSASVGCGRTGVSVIAIAGDASCSAWFGCGIEGGTAPIAIGGNAHCVAPYGCGQGGTAPIAIGGNATCYSYRGCGREGTGPIAIGGNADCRSYDGCGNVATGPIATGDVRCEGACGSGGEVYGVWMPRRGTPAIAVTGEAECDEEFDAARAADREHLEAMQCISIAEVAGI